MLLLTQSKPGLYKSFVTLLCVIYITDEPGILRYDEAMCEWRSELDEDYRCKVPPEPGSKFCIFHEPGEKDIERFKQAFYSQIREEGSPDEGNPKYDFRGYVFPMGLTVLSGEGGLVLPGEISGVLIMVESTIKGHANFWDATIGGNANFWDATIGGNANFRGATIGGFAGFRGAIIGGFADFGRATIGGDAHFRDGTIDGVAYFRRATIDGNANFSDATIGGNANFSDATIGGNANFEFKHLNGGFRLTNASVGRLVRFNNPVFHKRISFDHCVAGGLDIGEGKPRLRGWGQQRSGVTLTDVSTGYSFWRFARLTFEKEGRKNEADAAHYFERMWRWKALRSVPLEEEASEEGILQPYIYKPFREVGNRRWEKRVFTVLDLLGIALILRCVHVELAELNLSRVRQTSLRAIYTIMWLFDLVFLRWPTQYGASLSRVFVTWGLVIGAFAATYHLAGMRLFDPLPHSTGLAWPLSFGRALYFSIITFTTLGYGDIKPAPGLGSALCATEAILGGIMMALTVLVIGRKFMR